MFYGSIVFLDHENIDLETNFIQISLFAAKYFKKIEFSIMAELICIIEIATVNKLPSNQMFYISIVFLDHENIGLETNFVQLS